MKINILIIVVILGLTAYSNSDDNSSESSVNQNSNNYQISKSNIFNTTPEKIEKVKSVLSTITVQDGFITSILKGKATEQSKNVCQLENLQVYRN